MTESLTPTQCHWTERSPEDFAHSIASNFEAQLDAPEREEIRGLLQMVREARAVGKKIGIVVYDDGDPSNRRGPISGGVFVECWKRFGSPKDFFELENPR